MTVLILRGEHRLVPVTLCAATGRQLVLFGWLIPKFGATGSATSHAVATVLLCGALGILARRSFARMGIL